MFDNKMIVEDSLKATDSGFTIEARLPYYRGLGLSMIENVAVSVDGEAIPREDITVSLRGRTWTLDEMETEYGDRWNFGEKALVGVKRAGGLAPGEHRIELAETMRISYLPFVPTTKDAKTLTLR
ncbi:hypothetical protein SUS17_1839 [Sphingomonas sp. S17]|jgi:hypothetical protein|uniref:C-deglycosylation enzyme beta subunit n=2 Tax=Sphingomonas paucimobilis TaxID=13689 RepID=A0A7T3A9J5_SPHPI|nr:MULTISPECIES: DUF6379 domain-containing protein [Sphingomonas]EGI55360.1 hypothetical protein SUS17_1839 [Sphingomonas sp. S17]MCM3680942.1 DUF6379 domain-containing protein [Sphingomonas paucimobilis]MDG5971346.1 hypothetical protein [Sphingomonas paucimobilis]QPS15920.1 hypothetical protein I6G65_16715 [Sphingomonas paucimobilis]QPT07374.1 hypothetical protein I6G38_10920 [Sphingomonas paucimobilis]